MNNNVFITEALQDLHKMSRMSDSKSLKEGKGRKRRLKESYLIENKEIPYKGYYIITVSGSAHKVIVKDSDGNIEGYYGTVKEAKDDIDSLDESYKRRIIQKKICKKI